MRSLLVVALLAFSSCGLKLVRGPSGWALDNKMFTVDAIPDGRLMPDGWLLQNYKKVEKGQYRQSSAADVDLTFSRSDDDGFLAVDQMHASAKTLRTLAERFMSDLRTRQLEVSVGNYRAYVDVDEPVTELAAAPIEGEGIEGYEIVVSQRHRGENDPYRHIYLALIRSKATVVAVYYMNSPNQFLRGVEDVRSLARRVKIQGVGLSTELPSLKSGPPAPGAPVQM
jgi:hypothetical protein